MVIEEVLQVIKVVLVVLYELVISEEVPQVILVDLVVPWEVLVVSEEVLVVVVLYSVFCSIPGCCSGAFRMF